jgi:hypothetical protein
MKRGDEKRTARVIESLARLLLLLLLQMQELNGWLQNGNAGVGVVIICHRETTTTTATQIKCPFYCFFRFFLSLFLSSISRTSQRHRRSVLLTKYSPPPPPYPSSTRSN